MQMRRRWEWGLPALGGLYTAAQAWIWLRSVGEVLAWTSSWC